MKKYFPLIILATMFTGCGKEKKSNEAALKMQDFVVNISDYARGIDPDFIIIPQNGTELAWTDIDPDGELNSTYMGAVDGFGAEEIFYNGTFSQDDYRLQMLRKLVVIKKIMVSEYVNSNNMVADAYEKNHSEGFICFTRTGSNYDYMQIPDSVPHENANNVTTLSMAQNFLYLISNEGYADKQSMLNAIAATNYDVVLIDLFFEDAAFTQTDISQLKTKANGGQRLVIAYMNIGAAEKFRYYWKDS